ncbi:hypothetical protein GCM10010317_001300 [Streptomyces mirabilis]|nr:hypothetical protein GCM10010317_001300 [Streptomyces mirabilis]
MFSSPAWICFSGPKEVCIPGPDASADREAEAEADIAGSVGSEAPAVPMVRIRENMRLSMTFTFLDRCVESEGIDKADASWMTS